MSSFLALCCTHLNAPDLQPAKTSFFLEAVTLSDDQFYQVHFINSTWLLLTLLVPLEALRIFFVFNIRFMLFLFLIRK